MSESTLARKQKLLILEAKRLQEFDELLKEDSEILIRNMLEDEGADTKILSLDFIRRITNSVDDYCDEFYPVNRRSMIEWQDDVFKTWYSIDPRQKRLRPEPGCIAVMHYFKHGKILTSGQLAVVTKVNSNIDFETIEGNNINSFEGASRASQRLGINKRVRTPRGTAKIGVLGYVVPWL